MRIQLGVNLILKKRSKLPSKINSDLTYLSLAIEI